MTRDHDMLSPVAGHAETVNFTRCPYCQAVFRVRKEKLAVRQGEVRCGACREVFNATRHFVIQDLSGRFVPREDDAVDWGREVSSASALVGREGDPESDTQAGSVGQPEPPVPYEEVDDTDETENAADPAEESTAGSGEQQETIVERAASPPRPGYGMEFFPAPGASSRGAEKATAEADRVTANVADEEDGRVDHPEADSEDSVRWEPFRTEESTDSASGSDDATAGDNPAESEPDHAETSVATGQMAESAAGQSAFGPKREEQPSAPLDWSVPSDDPRDTDEEQDALDSEDTVSLEEKPGPLSSPPGTGDASVEAEAEPTPDAWTTAETALAEPENEQTEARADAVAESIAAANEPGERLGGSFAPVDDGDDQDPEAPSPPEETDEPAEVRHWSLADPDAVLHDADPVIDAPRASGQGKWFHIDPDAPVEKNPFRALSGPLDEPSRNVDGSAAINMNGVDDYIVDRPNPLATLFWFVIALGFVFLLGLQVRTYFVDRYAQDERFRPYLSLFCRVAACELPVRRDTYRFAITHTRIDLHPDEPGALRITVKLVNQAPFSQPYPDLQLTLTDRVGRVVGRRTFGADFYLAERKENLLESGELGTVEFDLAHPHEAAVGFVVDIVREPAA